MVRPILAVKVRMGLFDNPYVDEGLLETVAAEPENRQAARWAAHRSMVLLKNDDGLLPLAAQQNIAVIGPLADSMEATEGSWMVFGHKPARSDRAGRHPGEVAGDEHRLRWGRTSTARCLTPSASSTRANANRSRRRKRQTPPSAPPWTQPKPPIW
ncbi:MAG: glycoside hydrolase family 3 C-terminal domain-containing protein [Caldilineaceae bacterium]